MQQRVDLKGAARAVTTALGLGAMTLIQRARAEVAKRLDVPAGARILYEPRPWAVEKEEPHKALDETWNEDWMLFIQGQQVEAHLCTTFREVGLNLCVVIEFFPDGNPRVWILDADKRRDEVTMRGLYQQQLDAQRESRGFHREAPMYFHAPYSDPEVLLTIQPKTLMRWERPTGDLIRWTTKAGSKVNLPVDTLTQLSALAFPPPPAPESATPESAGSAFIRSSLAYDFASDHFTVWITDGGSLRFSLDDLEVLRLDAAHKRTEGRLGDQRARHERSTERCTECGHEERNHKLTQPESPPPGELLNLAPGQCECDGCPCNEFQRPW